MNVTGVQTFALPIYQGILELADDPAALCEGRIRRRLRHHPRDVRDRRIEADARRERRLCPRLAFAGGERPQSTERLSAPLARQLRECPILRGIFAKPGMFKRAIEQPPSTGVRWTCRRNTSCSSRTIPISCLS